MALKFQYNKTTLGELDMKLKMRNRALPTIKSKESALRMEVKKARDAMVSYNQRMVQMIQKYDYMMSLWGEFEPDLIRVKDVDLSISKIAGVRIPVLEEVYFEQKKYNIFSAPVWTTDGITILKQMARLGLEQEFFARKMELLEYARKKTTQKVNLYEKVQIPGYEDAIRKIKRFLDDEENISKASQKIVKIRHAKEQEDTA